MAGLCARFVLTVCLCTYFDVSLQTCPPPPPNPASEYYKETDNADFAIRMKSEGQKIRITISYDTDTNSADDFFKSQLTVDLIDGFLQCGVVDWIFNPCTLARFQNGNLVCTSEAQCTNDKFHGCIATAFRNFPGDMGRFLVCVYSGSSMEECGNKYHLIWRDDIEKCVKEGRGAQLCNNFHTSFVDAKTKQAGDTAQVPCAITNFKETACWVLGQAGLKCDAVCSK